MLKQVLLDRPFIDGKFHTLDGSYDSFNRFVTHGWEADPRTGLDDAAMKAELAAYIASLPFTDHRLIKAHAFAFVLDNMRIDVNEHDYFPLLWNRNRPLHTALCSKWAKGAYAELSDEESAALKKFFDEGDNTIWVDFDHSVPDWQKLYQLGFPGVRESVAEWKKKHAEAGTLTEFSENLFDAILIEYDAILRLIRRLRSYALGCTHEKAPIIAACLDRLAKGAPQNTYDRLMLIYLYFLLSETIDGFQVRALGDGIDADLAVTYHADIAAGTFTEDELDDFIGYFLLQFSAIGNYWGQPMYIGGCNYDKTSLVSDVTLKILDIYDELGLYDPKIQAKYCARDPKEYTEKLLDMVRRNHSSIVFVCNDNVWKDFERAGYTWDEYWNYGVTGCYEYKMRGGYGACGGYPNLLAPVMRALESHEDFADSDEFIKAVLDKTTELFMMNLAISNKAERHIGEINPSLMLTATDDYAMARGLDAYFDGGKYIRTGWTVSALGSAVDAVMATKWLVFDKKLVTIPQLKDVLAGNWSDEKLRLHALACPHKYGIGDAEADAYAAKLCEHIAAFQRLPNSRGGKWAMEIHSARQFIDQGKKMGATPDGRLAGEETSKNGSPVIGMDRNGVTAVVKSALATKPYQFHTGYGLDLALHETSARGEDGMAALKGLLAALDAGGGISAHFNVINAETLREAQENPQKYENLQIRVCGWNTLWNNMAKVEQDKYIERAENLAY